MAYTPTNWEDSPSVNTPITATRLNNIETGIDSAHDALDGRLSDAALSATIGDVAGRASVRPANVADFGAVGDGVNDDTAAIASAMAASQVVEFEPGKTYLVSGMGGGVSGIGNGALIPQSGHTILGNGATLQLAPHQPALVPVIELTSVENVRITDLQIDGNRANQSAVGTQDSGLHGVRVYAGRDLTLERLYIRDCYADGIHIRHNHQANDPYAPPENIILNDVTSDGNRRQGMSVIMIRGLHATRCRFINTSGTSPEAGVDIEPPTMAGEAILENIFFSSCEFSGNSGWGFILNVRNTADRLEMSGCTFRDNVGLDLRLTGPHETSDYLQNVLLDHNTFRSAAGVDLGIPTLNLRNMKVMRNNFHRLVKIQNARDVEVLDNSFPAGTTDTRLWLVADVRGATVDRNYFEGGTNAVRVSATGVVACADILIARNRVRSVTARGVLVDAPSERVRINDNDIAGCGSEGIRTFSVGGQLRGNVVRDSGTGVYTGSSSTALLIADNQCTGNTANYSIAGTGHTQRDNL